MKCSNYFISLLMQNKRNVVSNYLLENAVELPIQLARNPTNFFLLTLVNRAQICTEKNGKLENTQKMGSLF